MYVILCMCDCMPEYNGNCVCPLTLSAIDCISEVACFGGEDHPPAVSM